MGQEKAKPKPPENPSDKMFDNIFEFKMMAKQFAKESKKAETAHKNLLTKVKDLIAKGDYEHAKITAADAIRKKNETKRYQVLSSKIDTISQRLQSAYQTQQLTENMKSLTEKMISTNIGDMVQINETMANFEKMFDDLDVNSNMMNEVFDNVNVGTTNDQEVNELINQVAEANGMKVMDELDVNAGQQPIQQPGIQDPNKMPDDFLP
jgi:charged multivesicular body protein 1